MSTPSTATGEFASVQPSSKIPNSTTMNGPIPDINDPVMQIQQKYSEERNKRLRPEGTSQFVDLSTSDKFRHFEEDPWFDANAAEPAVPALTDGSRCKVLILGAGLGGLIFAVRLMEAGIDRKDIRMVDSAGGFGGTWYWNRYPGLMCDVESYCYLPLLEETGYMPKHRYSYGSEIREYAESIAEKWELRDKTMFRTEAKNLTWDDNEKEWVVKLTKKRTGQENFDITIRSQFVISVSGVLSAPHLPKIPGIEDFRGHSFHTSRWDYKYSGGSPTDPSLTNLKDKRVAIIGTGATAVQLVPHLAKWAKELFVFQRTPSSVDTRGQRPTDVEWWTREIQGKKGWQRERRENMNARVSNAPTTTDMVDDGWTNMPSFSAIIGGPAKVTPDTIPAHVASLHAMDFPRAERVRKRVDQIVNDKATAEKLKAWYPSWCKRPCFHDDYLSAFNLPHVKLVDTDGKGVDRITEHGIVVNDAEYKVDLLIFSTGFRSPSIGSPAFRAGMSVTGRDGLDLDRKWAEGVSTLHGVVSRGFPNLFWPGPLQGGASANQMYVLEAMATHVSYILAEAGRKAVQEQQKEHFMVEPTAEAEEEWGMQILMRAATFAAVAGCTPGYMNREGEADRISSMEDRMKAGRGAIWGEGIGAFVEVIEGWRSQGDLKGLEVTAKA